MRQQGSGKVRVAVLFGGQSDEHDVSLRSAETVIGALDPDRFEVVPVGVTRDGRWLTGGDPLRALMAASPFYALGDGMPREAAEHGAATSPSSALAEIGSAIDVVFPVLHGPMGEDGTVQGLLELTGLPYVGSGVLGSAVAMDKAMAKTVLAGAGLPQVPWRLVQRTEWERDPATVTAWVDDALGFPCFVKPANMGSSVGVAKAHSVAEFPAAMAMASAYDRRIIIERGVDARELEMSVLGNDEPMASIAGEVVAGNEFYDYNAKYVDDTSQIVIPADIDRETMISMQRLAIDAFRALDLAGLARVDFFLERGTDHLLVNEVNTIPGFTSISMYPKLWEASGIPLAELVERLIGLARERRGQRQR
jgi:D-alanine-D-alanine ligase